MGSQLDGGSSESVSWFDQTWFGRGIKAASTTGEATDLMSENFSNIDMNSIQEFMKAKESEAKSYVESERMKKFQEQYIKEGKTWSAFFRGVRKQPGLLPELFVQSLGTQVGTLIDSPGASLAAAGTGAGAGAIGGIPGAVAGAMGGLATSMEAALTFGELIETRLKEKGLEFTDENIKNLLETEGREIRNKALGRGLAIGAIEGFTGGLAGKAAVATKGAVQATRAGKIGKTGALLSGAAGVGVEAVGGATGEITGRAVAGQEMDAAEIGFEAITGTTTAPINVLTALKSAKQPTYRLNGEKVTYNQMKDFVDTADDIDIAKADIQIRDDYTGVGEKAKSKQEAAEAMIELSGDEATIAEVEKAKDLNKIAATIELAKQGKQIGNVKDVFAVENDKEAAKVYKELQDQYGKDVIKDENVAGADGFFVPTPDGNVIIINKEVAAETGQINVGGHELLHAVVQKHYDSLTPEARAKFINDFKNTISKESLEYVQNIIDARNKDRKDPKTGKTIKGENIQADSDEYLTIYSDGIVKKQITYNESIFTKFKNFLQNIFRKFGYNKEFGSGLDTYNFMRDYNKNIMEFNKISKRAKSVAGTEAVAGEGKFSITAIAKEAQETVDEIGRKATTKEQYDQGVNIEAYNYLIEKQGLDGLIISELNKRGIDTKAEDANVNGVPLNDYMEDVRAKLIPDVLGFNPEAEVTKQGKFGLSGYINQRLKFRMGDVATKAKKTVTGKSIETPVGETGRTVAETIEDEGDVSLQAFEEQDLSVSAQNRATETEQDKNELKSRYRHKLKNNDGTKLISETRVESIREGIRSTLTKLADKAVSPDFLFNFEKIVKKDLKNIVQKAIGNKKQYVQFVLKNMSDIVDFTSVQDLVALERLVGQGKLKGGKKIFTVAVKRLTKIEDIQKAINQGKLPIDAINKSKEGVMLYEKRMPTEEELKAFFFGENMQEVLGYKLGGSTLGTRKDGLSRMIITELSQDGLMETIQEPDVAEEILSISQEANIDVIVKNVATQVNRSPDLKFSRTSLEDIIKDPAVGKDTKRGAIILIDGDGYQSEAWKKFMDDEKVSNKVKLELNINYLQRDIENWFAVRKMKGVAAKLKSIKGRVPTYRKFEIIARDVAKEILEKEGYSVAHLTEVGDAPDIIINKRSDLNTEIGIEIKGTTARAVSRSFNYKEGRGFLIDDVDASVYSENTKLKVQKLLNKANTRIEKIFKDLNITPKYNNNGNLIITKNDRKKLKRKRLHLDKNFVEFIEAKDIEFMYLNKTRPSEYINLGVAGLFQLGSTNPLNIEDLSIFGDQNIDIPITVRFDFNSTAAGVRMSIRIEPQLNSKFFETQSANLFGLENSNIKIKKSITKDISTANNLVKASRSDMSKPSGASIFDFDETVGVSENFVIATKEGITKRIPSEEWPLVGETLEKQGYKFDFTDFNKVTKGKPGPLLQKMKNQIKKYGPKNVFILTARAPESQQAIHDWLKSEGVNIPVENITGLGNSTAEAKASWVLDKYANKNYNDIYFVDDALQNVQAVQNMFDQLDIKGKSVQAKVKFSKSMNDQFNDILEDVTGIEAKKRFSEIKARKRGASKGKFRLFIPPSHEDFVGLLYNFMGKGRKGDQHRNFFEQALVKPLNRVYREIDTAKQAIANDYKSLNKQFPEVKKKLTKETLDGDFTFQDAIRVYLWNKHGYDIPGLTKTDQAKLVKLVMNDADLVQYAETLNIISKQDTYVDPGPSWETGNIRIDLIDATGRVGRAQYFTEFNENAEAIFSPENLNKIEAAYGKDFREALEDMLHAIKTGINRPKGANAKPNMFLNWLNASVSGVMFFNTRSSILQQMSIVNYINFADNNMYAAGKAFANQPQYWKDWAFIFNSDMLKQRRGGIGTDINGAELAEAVKKARPNNLFDQVAIITGKLLKLGFLPTQIGDNIAIATGGATFYRNRINKYIKDGMSKKEAEAAAFTDFQNLTQSTQQSSRPDMTSQQQRSWIGKFILNFQNITSQYNRIIKKAALDVMKGRISPPYTTKAQSNLGNLSKILYYGGIQNVLFYSLQTALFAVMFDDDEDEDQILKKKERVINGTIDSILRGSGIYGAVASTLKNMVIKFNEQREKGYNKDESAVLMEALNLSPIVGIRARGIVNAEKTLNYNMPVIKEMETFDLDNPMWSAVTNYVQVAGFPANRLYQKSINMRNALNTDYTNFQRALFFSGYTTWSLGLGDNEAIIEAKEKAKINKANAKKRKKKSKGIPNF